jgi:hypothetical protein
MSYQHGPTAGPPPPPPNSWVPGPGGPPPVRKRRSRRWILAAVAGITAAVVVGVTVTRDDGPTGMQRAAEAVDSPDVDLGDDGHTLIVDSEGEDSAGADLADLYIVLAALDVPESVIAQMDSTRALDGTRDATWDGMTATWTYHPDDGLDVIITDR